MKIELNEKEKETMWELMRFHAKHQSIVYDHLDEESRKWFSKLYKKLGEN